MESAGESTRRPAVRVFVALVVTAIYLPPVITVGLRTDVGGHLRLAEIMALTGREYAPYNLFEQLVIIVRSLVPFGALEQLHPALGERATIWDICGAAVVLAAVVVTADLIHGRLASTGDLGRDRATTVQVTALTIAAMVVTPVTVLTWSSRNLMVGYVSLTSYENPTSNLARPLALLLLWHVAGRMFASSGRRVVVAVAAVSVLALLAKPSFTICFLPAMVLVTAWALYRRRQVDRRLLVWGFFVPSIAVLVFQLAMAQGEGGVEIDPLRTISELYEGVGRPLWMFPVLVLMATLFPVVVVVVHREAAVRSFLLMVAWLTFAVGLALFVLFRITGRTDYGDLVWGPQIALLLVFVESIRVALPSLRRDRRSALVVGALGLHVVSGAVLWYAEVVHPAAWW